MVNQYNHSIYYNICNTSVIKSRQNSRYNKGLEKKTLKNRIHAGFIIKEFHNVIKYCIFSESHWSFLHFFKYCVTDLSRVTLIQSFVHVYFRFIKIVHHWQLHFILQIDNLFHPLEGNRIATLVFYVGHTLFYVAHTLFYFYVGHILIYFYVGHTLFYLYIGHILFYYGLLDKSRRNITQIWLNFYLSQSKS